MSNELTQYQGGPMSLPDKIAYSKALAEGGMIPKVYQRNPANILVAVEYGEALGIRPIVAMNEINVINGTPSPSASLMASLARAAGHRVRTWNEDDGSAVCEIIRADDPDFTHRSVWTETKARGAGLWGKGHWSKDPATMLRWRAISECVRMACPEVLGGLKYTPEEVMEFQADRPVPVSHAPSVSPNRDQATEESAPVSPIPDTLADQITGHDDPAWLSKVIDHLETYRGRAADAEIEHLQMLATERIHALTDPQPETAEVDAEVDELAMVQETLDAELIDESEVTA